MLNIYIKMGTPSNCAKCGKLIRRGQRVVTDGELDFDTCMCYNSYHEVRA